MNPIPSPASCGARNGLTFGLFMTAMYFAMLFSTRSMLINLMALGLMLYAPVYLYNLVRADHVRLRGAYSTGSLWLDGLLTTVFGSLIAAAALLIFLRWIHPGFLYEEIMNSLEIIRRSGNAASVDMAATIERALDNGLSLSPAMFAMSMMWLAAFLGSIFSLAIAAILRHRPLPPAPTDN